MKNKSFTLIELLVVIAIIGLLTSIILVSMQGVRAKARITKALEFSQSVQHVLGAYAVGRWSFETIEAGKVLDASGYDNHGIVNGGTLVAGLEQLGNALSFDGVNDYMDVLNFGNSVSGVGEITIEAWLNPAVSSGNDDFLWFSATGDKRITVHFPWNTGILWQFGDFSTCGLGLTLDSSWVGTWAHYAFIASKSGGYARIYRNGVQIKTSTCTTNPLPASSVALKIGGRGDAGYGFQGLIDEVGIYERALSMTEIQQHYVEGLEKHKNLATK